MIELRGRFEAAAMPPELASRLHAFVDADQVRGVVACDTLAGWADAHHRDERGRFVMAAGVAVLVRLRGTVRLFVDRLDPTERAWLEGCR